MRGTTTARGRCSTSGPAGGCRCSATGGTLVADAPDAAHAERFRVDVLRTGAAAVADAAAAADVVVLVTVGNDPHLRGRETEDRPHLDLPAPQVALWRAARAAAYPGRAARRLVVPVRARPDR